MNPNARQLHTQCTILTREAVTGEATANCTVIYHVAFHRSGLVTRFQYGADYFLKQEHSRVSVLGRVVIPILLQIGHVNNFYTQLQTFVSAFDRKEAWFVGVSLVARRGLI